MAGRVRSLFFPKVSHAAEPESVPKLLRRADEIVVIPPERDGSERWGGWVAEVYSALRATGKRVLLARNEEEAREHAVRTFCEGDLTYCDGRLVSSGELLPALPQRRRIWIGQGSNTWKSELDLDVIYERTKGPADRPGATLGIPWMAGIPGTVGGWIKMNAGAFGHSFSEALAAVCVDGKWREASQCGFGYRHSDLEGEISDFRLKPLAEIPFEGSSEWYLSRRRKFPAHTFGSVFKNPEGDFAGRILEQAGAKDLRVGGAFVWSEHANVLVAGEGSTPSDILALFWKMQSLAYASSRIVLDSEVRGIQNHG